MLAGRNIWPASPFLPDGRIVLSSQGIGQKVGDDVFKPGTNEGKRDNFSCSCQVSILVVELFSSEGNNLMASSLLEMSNGTASTKEIHRFLVHI